MHARSAVFDLYGDHLRERGNWAPIASVVRLLGAVGIAAPAVRTAVSRLVREGWLEPVERNGQRGYAATARARGRLAEARARIYRTGAPEWDGQWHLVITDHPADRARRTRVSAALGYLGYARLAADTWIAPRANDELGATLAAEAVDSTTFTASYDDGRRLAATVYDLSDLADAYRGFLEQGRDLRQRLPDRPRPEPAYALRTTLVHDWRKFLFRDPGLPAEILTAEWPGHEAAALFDELSAALLAPAREFVGQCLAGKIAAESGMASPANRPASPAASPRRPNPGAEHP